ncbi:MAG: SusD/RagB family nutrient-binding outer membrane lipoprotein [Cyclobacteriaceae bacterium]|nr:SusD/RagB family nutrient-binding outer membrane lipoprotein [Cyclobacteriaceae bacterium]
MKNFKFLYKFMMIAGLIVMNSCVDELVEMNKNPNGIDPANANPNLLMSSVLSGTATSYLNLGYGNIAGTIQHTQKDGWWSSHNVYDWGPSDWNGWYGLLRSNELMIRRADDLGYSFHKGVGLVMKSFIYANITDIWGDAPYTEAMRGNSDVLFPRFDSQEVIYQGIIEDLKAADALFATGNTLGMSNTNDFYFQGNITRWRQFANSLLLRYYMRLSEKLPQLARSGIESVYQAGFYIKTNADDATMEYLGNLSADSWPENTAQVTDASGFRRIKPCQTLVDKLLATDDPRTKVWFRPVHCRWVADETLTVAIDPFIRENGQYMPLGNSFRRSFLDAEYIQRIAAGNVYTRHFNPILKAADPALAGAIIDTNEIVGIPAGAVTPDGHNFNPTVGQIIENQHVSQLADIYRQPRGPLLRARLISASETFFILAEAAAKGWNVGSAEAHYNAAIQQSLNTWGIGNQYAAFIAKPGVAFNAATAMQQIADQKWIASWTNPEGWFDWRRTGLPNLQAGPASLELQVAVRFPYGNNEINFNNQNVLSAVSRLVNTLDAEARVGANNQWAKPWIIQGTGKPW